MDNDIDISRAWAVAEQIKSRMDTAKRWIWVTFQREGIHCYPDALSNPLLATGDKYDVSFLGNPHRHIFHFKISIEIFHLDRDIEFIQFKRWIENMYTDNILQLNHQSCEMIACNLYERIAIRYPGRAVKIDVSEDNENGAYLEFTAE